MALRAFHCNPSLGGFGNETETNHPNLNLNPHSNRKSSSKTSSGGSNSNSSPLYPKASESGDAFAQIVKELVDNAVDACSTSYDQDSAAYTSRMNRSASKSSSASASKCPPPPPLKRVRVSLERVKSKNSNEEENMEQQQRRDLLRLTISDTGCGMQDIEKYVSAFSSSKIHDDDDPQKNPKTKTNADGNGNGNGNGNEGAGSDSLLSKNLSKETAGRYGVGLTLCLIHAQRLVPNTCAIIKSTIEGSSSWTVAKFVVDTHRDCVVCVEKKILRKEDNSMSGTGISLMLPGGKEAKRAWPRLAEYFARFQLSLGLKCSLEVMAPSLSRLPLFIRPKHEVEHKERQRGQEIVERERERERENERRRAHAHVEESTRIPQNPNNEKSSIDATKDLQPPDVIVTGPDDVNKSTVDDTDDDFIDLLDFDGVHTHTGALKTLKGNNTSETGDILDNNHKRDNDHDGCESDKEWGLDLNEDFFASSGQVELPSRNPIETSTKRNANASKKRNDGDEKVRMQMQKSVSSYLKKSIRLSNVAHSEQRIRRDTSKATNDSPSIEVAVIVSEEDDDDDGDYGLDGYGATHISSDTDRSIAKLMLIRMVNRIPMLDGAEASACGVVRGLQQKSLWNSFGLEISPVSNPASVQEALHVPTFSLRDSAHLAPFFARNDAHALYCEDEDEDSDDSDYESDDPETIFNNMQKRKRPKKTLALRPAGLRLGNIIVIVQLNAKSSQLPLPTLSKGRLPMNDVAINTALQAGLNACLRSLQKTNPSLLLTAAQLKKTERDVIYIPTLASALSSLILNCNDHDLKQDWLSKLEFSEESEMDHQSRTEKLNGGKAHMDLTQILEDSIRGSLLNHEREKQQNMDKQKLRRKLKAAKKDVDDDSLSQSSSQYDLENFIDRLEKEAETDSLPTDLNMDIEGENGTSEDDMNSTFSSDYESADKGNLSSSDDAISCADPHESDDMRSTFSLHPSEPHFHAEEASTEMTPNQAIANNDKFDDDDEWW